MTSAEQQQLAAIERQLTDESPALVRALSGAGHPFPTDRRRWARTGVVILLVSPVLLVVGIATGVAAFAVFSICPLLTHLLLAAVHLRSQGRTPQPW